MDETNEDGADDDDEASLALNRRTEFVIQGLLVAPAPPPADAATTTAG